MVAQPQDRVVVEVVGGLIEQECVGLLEQNPGELDPTTLTARERADRLVEDAVGQAQGGADAGGLRGGCVAAGHGELVVQARVAVQGLGLSLPLGHGDALLGLADAGQERIDATGREDPVPGDLAQVPDLRVLRQVTHRARAGDRALVLDGLQPVALIGVVDGASGALGHGGGGEQLGHGGLTGAVTAHETDAHPLVDPEAGVSHELSGTDTHGEVLDIDHARHRTGPPLLPAATDLSVPPHPPADPAAGPLGPGAHDVVRNASGVELVTLLDLSHSAEH